MRILYQCHSNGRTFKQEIYNVRSNRFSTRKDMEYYSWCSLKMGIKAEMVGMKISRGVNACKQAREALGVKTKDKKALLELVQKKIDEHRASI